MSYPFEDSAVEPTTEAEDYLPAEDAPGIDYSDDVDNDAEPEAADEGDAKRSRRKPARAQKLTAGQVRRVLAQAKTIEDLNPAVRELLAATTGVADNVEDLVVATLNPSKAAADVITQIVDVAGEDDAISAVVLATAIAGDRESARRVWGLLTALDKVSGGIPAKEVQAGAKIVRAAKSFSLDDLAGLAEVRDLLG